ncbi:MAG TPA: DAK2 domain-containing protein [Actinobacteria bacterium]|nr:DAK2 domain-containing protein [Actinomycetota bacterium]HDK45468.1 DAK2 domain-containing protein [Actinomycetota bacterium]HDL48617.1 DAK2 domain-containing protein [Actinomycetota bacterium]
MDPRMHLTADHLKRVLSRYHEHLGVYRDALNRLNVYPVPDGDTGTNMQLTVGTVVDEMSSAQGMVEVTSALAHGSLMGARGNSGVILAQILRGLSDIFREVEQVGVPEVVKALERASEAAYQAVLHPVEGTILTVLRSAAEAAAETGTAANTDLGALLEGVFTRAVRTLESTPALLPVLERAGVVDAGGAGLLLLLAAFLEEVTGSEVMLPVGIYTATPTVEVAMDIVSEQRYEVVLILEAPEDRVDPFRAAWGRLGGSIVVVGGEGQYKCHIHTDHPAEAIEAAVHLDDGPVGSFRNLTIMDLAEQTADRAFHVVDGVSVIPVVAGEGLAALFRQLGAADIVQGGQSMNPSTQDLFAAVERSTASTVILLPNNKNILPAALHVDSLSERTVFVVPTASVPEGIAAMMGFLPGREPDELVDAMRNAAESVVTGEVTRAVRDARVEIGHVAAGDWLGIVDGSIEYAGEDLAETLTRTLDTMVDDDSELVTLFIGDAAATAATAAARCHLVEEHPSIEVEIKDGGQPLHPYLISVE